MIKSKKKKLLSVLFFCILIGNIAAQSIQIPHKEYSSNQVEVLLNSLQTAKGIQRIHLLNELSVVYENSKPSKAQEYAERAALLSKELNYTEGLGEALYQQGFIYYRLGNYEQALQAYSESLKMASKIKNDLKKVLIYQKIGLIFKEKQDLEKAMHFCLLGIQIAQKKHLQLQTASLTNDIGVIYLLKKDPQKASKNHQKALDIYQNIKDSLGTADSYQYLGDVSAAKKDEFVAIKFFLKALQIYEPLLDQQNIAKLAQKIGETYLQLNDLIKAEKLSQQSLKIAQKYQYKSIGQKAMKVLAVVYGKRQNWQQAYYYQNQSTALQDSIYQEEKLEQINEMQRIFKRQKEQISRELLEKDEIIQKDEKIIRQISQYAVWLVLLFLSLFAFSLYRNNRKRKIDNELLEQQKMEIVNQKNAIQERNHALVEKHHEITEKNSEFEQLLKELKKNNLRLTDSIRYAERIQRAILPATHSLRENFAEHFVIFKPKDVVSGDFYWFSHIEEENMGFLAVVDCTGHGVPGAFMSMIGNTLLNEIINHEKNYETDDILVQLHEGVRDSLKQNNNQNKDGMDLSLCRIKKLENQQYEVQFSGAKSQLYIGKEGEEITEIRGDRKSIGGWQKEVKRTFSKQEITLKSGEYLFLASDGYTDAADQKRKKIGYKTLKKILAQNLHLSMTEQGAALLETLYEHQKGVDQRDDITVIGIKL